MLKSFNITKKTIFYYDIDRKCIARFPTKSNLLKSGSDNSLYFGMSKDPLIVDIFKELFGTKDLAKISKQTFEMECINDIVNVCFNINNDGQLQMKILKDGTMFKLFHEFQSNYEDAVDPLNTLIVIDLNKKQIRFKKYDDLFL